VTDSRPFIIGLTLLAWVTALLLIGCLTILFTGQISALTPILAVPVAIATAIWCAPSLNFTRQSVILPVIIAFSVIAVSLYLSANAYDASWDGQGYQFEGTQAVADGWDIYRENAPDGAIQPLWLGFYSKGAWVTSGALVKLFDDIEVGKAVNLILMIAVLTCAPLVLKLWGQSRRMAWVLALFLALNPVSIAQMFTYYIDGQLAGMLTIVILMLGLAGTRPNRAGWVTLTAAAILLLSVKLNGAVYLTVTAGIYAFWHWRSGLTGGRTLLYCGIIAYVLGIGLVSWNPVVTQFARYTLEERDPFYPTTWHDITALDKNMPPDLKGAGAISIFRSLFAQYAPGGASPIKVPFTVAPEEIFWVADARWSGFGPLFSGALIVVFVTMLITANHSQKIARHTALTMALTGSLFGMFVFNSAWWWARYVPQLWVWVVIIVGMLWMISAENRWLWVASRVCVITLALNICLLTTMAIGAAVYATAVMRHDLVHIAEMSVDTPVAVNFDGFVLVKAHFDRAGVRYIESPMLPCEDAQKHTVQATQVKYCP